MSTQAAWEQIARELGPEVLGQIAVAAIRQAATPGEKAELAQRCRRALIKVEAESVAPAVQELAAGGRFSQAWQKVDAATKAAEVRPR